MSVDPKLAPAPMSLALGPMQLKGTAVASTLRAIERLHGLTGAAAVRAALPAAMRHILDDDPVLAVRWYPVELVASLHVAVRDVVGHGDWKASHALGMTAAREDFKNLYRIAIRALNATTVWTRMERMWTLYNSRGSFHWLELKPGAGPARKQSRQRNANREVNAKSFTPAVAFVGTVAHVVADDDIERLRRPTLFELLLGLELNVHTAV